MKISIAMCTYNGSRFLEEQLQSIRAQTMQPFELIICDDGSTDATEQIVEAFRASVSFPVHFSKNTINLGSTRNFEQAICLCKGDAIALCDQDDRWFPEKLSTMSAVLEMEPEVAGVFSNARIMDENGVFLELEREHEDTLWHRAGFTPERQRSFRKHEAPFQLISRDTVTGAAFLFRARYVEHLIPFSEDWIHDGWIAFLLASLAELRPLPACLMSYRVHVHQQVGARQIPWYTHLSTQKQAALASHRLLAQRLSSMADKLDTFAPDRFAVDQFAVDPGIAVALRRKVTFLERRTAILGRSRSSRVLPVTQLLPDYIRYQRGIMSLLRDLFH